MGDAGVAEHRARVDSHDRDNNTALLYAAMRGSLPIAQALIGLVHGIGCTAVAEGIESAAQTEGV